MDDKLRTLIEDEGRAAEEYERLHPDAPLPADTKVTRGHNRTKTLQVRLNDDEYDAIETLAHARDLPASTVARSILLKSLAADESPASMLDTIEAELATLRTKIA